MDVYKTNIITSQLQPKADFAINSDSLNFYQELRRDNRFAADRFLLDRRYSSHQELREFLKLSIQIDLEHENLPNHLQIDSTDGLTLVRNIELTQEQKVSSAFRAAQFSSFLKDEEFGFLNYCEYKLFCKIQNFSDMIRLGLVNTNIEKDYVDTYWKWVSLINKVKFGKDY